MPELEEAKGVRSWIGGVVLHFAVSSPWTPARVYKRSLVCDGELLTVLGDLLDVPVSDGVLALLNSSAAERFDIIDWLCLASIVRPFIGEC